MNDFYLRRRFPYLGNSYERGRQGLLKRCCGGRYCGPFRWSPWHPWRSGRLRYWPSRSGETGTNTGQSDSSRRGEPLADAFVYWVRWRPPGGSDCQRAATSAAQRTAGDAICPTLSQTSHRHSASLSIGHSLQMSSHGTRRLLGGRLQSRCGPPRQGSQGVAQTPADTPDLMRSSGPLTRGSA
jgi:hypothetical protein